MNLQKQTEPKLGSFWGMLSRGLLKILGVIGYWLITLVFVVVPFMPVWAQVMFLSPPLLIVLLIWWHGRRQKG